MTSSYQTPTQNPDNQGQLGQYQLLEELGQGGMGTVYRAVNVNSGAEVAIKTVRQLSANHMNQIQREIYVLSQLTHPGIISIIEHGLLDGQPWYAMDFVPGVTLRRYAHGDRPNKHKDAAEPDEPDTLFDLYESPTMQLEDEDSLATSVMLPPSQAGGWWTYMLGNKNAEASGSSLDLSGLRLTQDDPQKRVQEILQLLRRLCLSLSYLHGQGLVHCDLKPGNILVRQDRWPVLIDFGLLMQFTGRAGRESIESQRIGQGTPAYMSPEQIEGALLDARTDLYSLGCVLFELLTGRPPFIGTHKEILEQHRNATPEAPSRLGEGIPPALDQIVKRLLAKKPQERIGYADTLRNLVGKLVPPDRDIPPDWQAAANASGQFYLYRPGFVSRPALIPKMEVLTEHLKPLHTEERQATKARPIWLIEGESGVGKTRLFLEIARQAHQRGRLVLTGECLDHHSPPYEGFLACLRTIAARSASADDETLKQILGPYGRSLLPYEPALQQLPAANALPPLPELPPNQMREIIHYSLHHALSALAKETPLLILIDDLQWADALTLGFLHYLQAPSTAINTTPADILIMAAYRSEELNESLVRLRSHTRTESMTLERFDEEGVGLLVKDMLALPTSPRMFSQFLATHSEGNPFFVAEYLRAAVESGLLWRHPQGRWHIGTKGLATDLEPDEESLPLPASLRAQVAQRLNDLSPHASTLINAAAIVDREITYQMLETLTQLSQHQLWGALEELQRKQILLTSPENTLRFAHDKLREVTYDRLENHHRQQLHRQAAEAIESAQEGLSGARYGDLANHWQRAGAVERALYYYKLAAELAEQQHDNEEAIRLYNAYIELNPDLTSETASMHLAIGKIQRLIGDIDQAEASFKQSWAIARQLGFADLEGQSQSALGLLYWSIGKGEESRTAHRNAIAIYQQIGNRASEGASLGDLATNYFLSGEIDMAKDLFAEALTIHHETGNTQAQAKDLSNLAGVYLEQGEFQTSRKLFETALVLIEHAGPRRYHPQVLNNLAHVYQYQQNLTKAQSLYHQSHQSASAQGDRRSAGMALGGLAVILRDTGQLEEAREAFQESIQIHRDVRNIMFEAVDWIELLVMERLLGQNILALKASLHKIEVLLRNASDSPCMALLQCEMGHVELAQGFGADERINMVKKLAAKAHVTEESSTQLGMAYARLMRAQEAVVAGETLFRGQRTKDIPEGLRERLQQDGHLPSSPEPTPPKTNAQPETEPPTEEEATQIAANPFLSAQETKN